MSKQGEAWIESPQKRALETVLIGPVLPAIGGVALVATAAVSAAEGPGQAIHKVPRSLYPGNTFMVRKLGNPRVESRLLRAFRQAMIDELPQVLDILGGSMALVGPRADTPAHIEELFAAIEDDDLRDRWGEVRSKQKPGIISSYAVHSHAHNLEGLSESVRFSEEAQISSNAHLRATLDVDDFTAASSGHDLRLVSETAKMALHNYNHYIHDFMTARTQPSEIL